MGKAWKDSVADYFTRSSGWSAKYDPDSSSWKMSQILLFGGGQQLLESFVGFGMTVDGALFPLEKWAPHIKETDGFYLPTPMASDAIAWTKVNKTDVQKSIAKTLLKSMDRLTYRFQWLSLSIKHAAEYVEWMMGYPKNWTVCTPLGTAWYQDKREKPSKG
jgi:hypothetical protein